MVGKVAFLQLLKDRGIADKMVLKAMETVDRRQFVPKGYESSAYVDSPLPIGHGQTISQPFIVAYMIQSLKFTGNEKVLEIGTGSGYAAAVLSRVARKVVTVERIKELAEESTTVLSDYYNIKVCAGDGANGLDSEAPYDRIILSAYVPEVPKELFSQLRDRGYLLAPVGDSRDQVLTLYRKFDENIIKEELLPVRFVPVVTN